jgi:hypothetical protein
VCCSSIFTCSVNFMRFYVFLSPISYHKLNTYYVSPCTKYLTSISSFHPHNLVM